MSEYFDYSTGRLEDGKLARAGALNAIIDLISTGFELLPSEEELKIGTGQYGIDTGSANTYVVELPYTVTSYTDGMRVAFKANASNTGASTINVDGVGAKSLTRQSGSTLAAGDVLANKFYVCCYNSTSDQFELVSPFGDVAMAAAIAAVSALAANSGVVISATDTTVGFLNGKLLSGDGVQFSIGNSGADETMTITTDDSYAFFTSIAF